jgi:hypothetical protein
MIKYTCICEKNRVIDEVAVRNFIGAWIYISMIPEKLSNTLFNNFKVYNEKSHHEVHFELDTLSAEELDIIESTLNRFHKFSLLMSCKEKFVYYISSNKDNNRHCLYENVRDYRKMTYYTPSKQYLVIKDLNVCTISQLKGTIMYYHLKTRQQLDKKIDRKNSLIYKLMYKMK